MTGLSFSDPSSISALRPVRADSTTAASATETPPDARAALGARGRGASPDAAGDAPEARERRPERSPDGLTDVERAQVRQLAARDREVKAHEQAHMVVGRPYTSAQSYEWQVGPDGQRYAVGGSVKIDMAPIDGDPEATAEKMRVVIAAALAPAEPSSADRAIAAAAKAQLAAAMADLSAQKAAERRGESEDGRQRVDAYA